MTDHLAPTAPGLHGRLRRLLVQGGKHYTRANLWTAAIVWLIAGGLSWLYFVSNAVSDLLLKPEVANNQLGSSPEPLVIAEQTAGTATGLGLAAVATLLVARGFGGISWAAVGMQRRDGRRLIVGGAFGVAAVYFTAMIAVSTLDGVLTGPGGPARIYPGSHTPDLQLLATDVTASTFGGAIWEELTLLAVPIALFAALVPLRKMTRLGRLAGWVALAAVLLAMRVAIHLYYGWPTAAMVALWAGAAIALFQLSGTVWPLIFAHAIYDAAAFTSTRVPAGDEFIGWAMWGTAAAGAVLLVLTIAQYRSRLQAARRRAATSNAR